VARPPWLVTYGQGPMAGKLIITSDGADRALVHGSSTERRRGWPRPARAGRCTGRSVVPGRVRSVGRGFTAIPGSLPRIGGTSPSAIGLAEHRVGFGVGHELPNLLRAAAGDNGLGSPFQRLFAGWHVDDTEPPDGLRVRALGDPPRALIASRRRTTLGDVRRPRGSAPFRSGRRGGSPCRASAGDLWRYWASGRGIRAGE
jgi:hypothetical protein